jgi:hypothetical protein
LLALGGGALSQGTMVLIMTATPLAMAVCGFSFADTAFVIEWHIVGMFAPSFFTGHLIARIGILPVMACGCIMILASLGIHLSGVDLYRFWTGLVLLGFGWNFMFVGATNLLTMTYQPAEKAKVQALNDLIIFGTAAAGSFLSGLLHYQVGWQAVNLGFIMPLLILFAALVWFQRRDVIEQVAAE